VSGDFQPVALVEVAGPWFQCKAQRGGAGEEEDDFVLVLVVPESRGAGLAGGDDALHPDAGAGEKCVELFLLQGFGEVVEQVHGGCTIFQGWVWYRVVHLGQVEQVVHCGGRE